MNGKTIKPDCTDATIIAGLKSGPGNAYNEAVACLYQNCMPPVAAWVLHNSGTAEDAEDVFQDAIVEFMLNMARGAQITTTVCGFLFGIARNLWLKKLRERGRDDSLRAALRSEPAGTEEGFEMAGSKPARQDEVVRTCWMKLSERCRNILTDYYRDGLSFEQIAEKYGYGSAHAARQTKMRCLQHLRECIGPEIDPDDQVFDFWN